MVTSQEIIERSFYMALMENTLRLGLTVDPNRYEKTKESMALYQQAVEEVKKNKNKFIQIFGVGNSQSKGERKLSQNRSRIRRIRSRRYRFKSIS